MDKPKAGWQLFTSHGLVLISLLNNQGKTIREIGQELDLTDRAVAQAIADLISDGYLVKNKVGRRCFYVVNEDKTLRYPLGIGVSQEDIPQITVRALRAENLATHADHLDDPENAPVRGKRGEVATSKSI